MIDDDAARRMMRERFRRNLGWIVPAVLIVGPALFFAIGHLVMWLWRVTLVDIFAIKTISFWQAWGLILLAQIFFKANLQPTTRTGRWRRGRAAGRDSFEPHSQPPPYNPEG